MLDKDTFPQHALYSVENHLQTELDLLKKEEQKAREAKDKLIEQALCENKITPQYALLLRRIHTATAMPEPSDLLKVRTALELRKSLIGAGINDGKMSYIGSGIDWEFPVSLGNYNIEMTDISYNDPLVIQALDASIQEVDPFASQEGDLRKFNIDLGEGIQEIRLNLITAGIDEYKPSTPLKSVLEFAGPTKTLFTIAPVTQNVAERLIPGSIIMNFDYHYNPAAPRDPDFLRTRGVEPFAHNQDNIFIVGEVNKIVDWTHERPTGLPIPTNPSLLAIRQAAKEKSK